MNKYKIKMFKLETLTSSIRKLSNGCCRRSNSIKNTIKSNSEGNLSKYSAEQQKHIIKILEKCIYNNTPRPYLNEKRLQHLKPLFENNQLIDSLEPLLSVSGIGPKLLCRICDSIINADSPEGQEGDCERDVSDSNLQKVKLPHNLTTPLFKHENDVESIVGIHLGINAVSWSRICISGPNDNQLDCWDLLDLSESFEKKYDVHSIWDLVRRFRYNIPDADIYVMENTNWSNIANIKKPMKYHILEAMLTTAICSIFNQVDSVGVPREKTENQLYFLRTFTPSRMFNKVIGSERVSAQDLVLNMMEGIEDPRHRPIKFTDDTAKRYLNNSGSHKDVMCRALLLVISFAELAIHHNPEALKAIGSTGSGKKKLRSTS